MQRSSLIFLLALVIFFPLRWLWRKPWDSQPSHPIFLGAEPIQTTLTPLRRSTIQRQGRAYILEHSHSYDITGEIVSTATYSWVFSNPFYDVDLGMIWGPKTISYKKKLKFYQGARWLMWRSETALSEEERRDILTHVGNLHLIPGNTRIEKAIHWASEGDRVRIQGTLVRILEPDMRPIISSSTQRDDTGEGACEIIWVDAFQIGAHIYR